MRRTVLLAATFTLVACERETFTKVHAQIAVTPERVDFEEILIGTSATALLEVANPGEAALEVCFSDVVGCADGTRLLPEGPGPFALELEGRQPGAPFVVPAGGSRALLVTYTPTAEGPAGRTLLLLSNALVNDHLLLPINGAALGPDVEVGAAALDFGEVTVGEERVLGFELHNRTRYTQPFSVRVPAEVGGGLFRLKDAPPSIPGEGSVTVRVAYQPQVEGAHAGVLGLSFCEGCGAEVGLTGRGVRPVVRLSPEVLDFGERTLGVPATQNFTVHNEGNVALIVLGVAPRADASTAFQVALTGLPITVAPGAQLNVPVVHRGQSPGQEEGALVVATNAWDDPATPQPESQATVIVRARSIGPELEVAPSRVSLGAAPVGTPVRSPLLLQNVGNAPLSIGRVEVSAGAPAIRLEGVPSLPTQVAPGSALVATVVVTAAAPGPLQGAITVESSDADEAQVEVAISATGTLPNVCALALSRGVLNFGLVARGRSSTQTLSFSNVGGQPCNLNNVLLRGAPGPFGLDAASAANQVLAPGAVHAITVAYAPTAYGTHNVDLELDTNDGAMPHVVVPLSGASAPTSITVVPPALDFGTVRDGCGAGQRLVSLYNTGSNAVNLLSASLDPSSSADFRLLPLTTPQVIPAGGQANVLLEYHGQGLGRDEGLLVLGTSEGVVPVIVPLYGQADPSGDVVDTYAQAARPADVLFVIDNSCSMEEEQSSLGSNLSSFVAFADAQNVDYRIAVTTTDVDPTGAQGAFVGTTRVITRATPNREQVFQENVAQGIYGAVAEQGLEGAYLALSDPKINTSNAGFLRPEARLSVIFISDEEDQSSRPRAFYESFFRGVKSDPSMVTTSAIVGTTNPECVSPTGVGDYAPRYLEVARATGGVTESICSPNWGQALTNIGQNTFGIRRSFPLSSTPEVSTLVVRVDGTPLPASAFSYQAVRNLVELNQAPAVGSQVELAYSTRCLP